LCPKSSTQQNVVHIRRMETKFEISQQDEVILLDSVENEEVVKKDKSLQKTEDIGLKLTNLNQEEGQISLNSQNARRS
jgi:hypothetical protein